MTKREFIEALQAIDGDDLIVVLDADGHYTTDYIPSKRKVDRIEMASIERGDVDPKPKLGDWIILL